MCFTGLQNFPVEHLQVFLALYFNSFSTDWESGTKGIHAGVICFSPMNGTQTKATMHFSLNTVCFWQVGKRFRKPSGFIP